MEYNLNNNYIIRENRLYVDNIKVNRGDIITYICSICKKEKTYKYREYMLNFTTCKECRTKQTNLNKYGKENAFQYSVDKIKKTKLKNYGNENYNNPEQTKQTNLNKYGTSIPYPFGSEKYEHIMQNKYGVNNALQIKEVLKKTQETKLEKYGNKNNYEKIKQTNLEKYGSKMLYSFGSEKYNNLIQNKYGVRNIFQLYEIKEKIKLVKLDKYGNKNYVNSKKSKQTKYNNTIARHFSLLENFGVKPLFLVDDFVHIYSKETYSKMYKWQCLKCENEFEDYISMNHKPRCPICYPYYKSIGEQDIINYIKSLDIKIIENDRSIISPYEIDIYLPDYKLAIEYNGLYYHSTKFIDDKYYHQNKVKLTQEQGIRLLHIWEHEWLEEQEQTKQVIQYYINNLQEEIVPQEPKLYNIHDNLIWI